MNDENTTKPPRTRRIAAVRRHDAAHPDWTPQAQREDFWNAAMKVFAVDTWTEVDERDANDPRWDLICPSEKAETYTTPTDVLIDVMTGNPPFGNGTIPLPDPQPLADDGNAAEGETGGKPCAMSRPEAVMRLMLMMKKRNKTVEDVNALKMACTALLKRHADHERNWAKRRAAQAATASAKEA